MTTDNKKAPASSRRLLSLDVLRGITIVGMIIVNNGAGPESFESLCHSRWNGLTPCDLVFPFFLFIMGVTTYLSMSRINFTPSAHTVGKILKRAILIILVGWAIHYFELVCKATPWAFSDLRLTGVLPRIGLCFGLTALLSLCVSFRWMVRIAVGLLVAYAIMLLALNGYVYDESNFNNIIDRWAFGTGHLYHRPPIDPEGLAGTLAALAHTIIGFCCGKLLKQKSPLNERTLRLSVIGFMLMAAGMLLSEWLPLNKRLWSPTFVLATTGLAAMLLATLIYFIDIRGYRRWTNFFEAFGVNPLFLYVLSEVTAIALSHFGNIDAIYEGFHAVFPDPRMASAAYAVSFMLLMGAVGWPLYKRRIYLKL